MSVAFCQLLFLNLFDPKRRRRDLNPRAAINDLHPFQGCPFGQLGYFSVLTAQFMILTRDRMNLTQKKNSYEFFSHDVSIKRRGWDSNPRALADKRFSRPPRYDHFDTSPYIVVAIRSDQRKTYITTLFGECQQ